MSTNRNVANLSIAFGKTLVKMAGFGFAADMIDGAQECLNLLADLKNDTLGNPNAEMIRGLNGAVKSELDAIQDALKHNGLGRKQVKQAAAQLAEAARETIKALAEDDDALIRAVQQPQCFAEQLRGHAAPLPDYSSDEMQAHYETLLDRIAEEFLTLAPWSPNFNRVALTSLLRCFPALSERIDRLEQHMDRRFDHIELRMRVDRDIHIENNLLLKGLSRQNASPIFDHVVFGSRPDVVAGDCFVPRGEQEQLNALIADPTRRRTVLMSMRGCGKTQLAASLAEQCEEANWNLVAWINAVSPDTIQSDLVELAKRLEIDTSDRPAQDVIVRRCLDHLKSAAPTDRLIVFDNVEDINHLTGLIPSGDGVRVVATTTNKVGWEDQRWNSIKVGVFDRNTSIEYLLTVTNSDDRDAADALAEHLGDLPLAIAQAAATARHKDLSLARYLKRLKSRGEELVIRPIPGDEYTGDVATVLWMAAEDAVDSMKNGTKEMARRQLGALALLAESGVPTRWLDPTIEQQDDWELQGTNPAEDEDAHDALTELIHRSIVQQSTDGSTTMLHRLQAQVLRESWNETECDEAHKSAAALLSKVDINMLPREDTKSRQSECIRLIEQLYAISSQEHCHSLFQLKEIILQLNQVFLHSHDLGLIQETLKLQSAVKIIQELFGRDDPITLNSRFNLASAYSSSGNLTDAVSLYESVLEDCTRILGADDSRTLTTRNNLAYTYQEAGRLPEAISMFEQILDDSMRILGSDHPNTLATRNNLAGAHASAEHFTEAISLYESVLDDSMRILGSDHPNTLATRNNLAGAHCAAGHLTEAIDLYKQVIVDRTRVLGEDHPDTLTSCNALAGAHYATGHLTEAINLYEQVLENRTQALGENHLDTLTTQDNLARVYASKGDFDEAITMYQRLITIRTRLLDSDHPHTLVSRDNLAGVYALKGDFDKAIAMYEKSYKEHRRILGEKHPSTLASCINLAGAYESIRRFEDSIRLYEHGLNSCSMVFGTEHPKTQTARHNLAHAYVSAGFIDKAIPLYEQVLKVNTQTLDDYHPNLVTTRNNLAHAYRTTGQIDSAITHYEKVLTDRIHILGENHPDTLATRNNLAAMYFEANRFSDAITIFERILTDCTSLLGKDDPRTLNARSNLGHTYALAGRLTNAFDLLIQVVDDYLSLLSSSHPDTLIARNNLAHAHALDGNLAEAIKQWQSVWIDCHKFLGPAHPLTGTVRENLEAARRELEQQEEDSANEESKQED